MPFDSAGFPDNQPTTPRKRRHVVDRVTNAISLLLFGLLMWWFWLTASDAYNSLVAVVAMSRLQ